MVQGLPFRAAVYVAAVFGIYLAIAMLIPAAFDLYVGHPDWPVFALSAFSMGGFSMAVALATHGRPPPISPRLALLVVNMLWLTMSIAGAIPFVVSSIELSLADAFFESVSGITATGATVLAGLDTLSPGLLIWRSILQWIGGLGVIALGLFILPFLNIGGVSYFSVESSDITERPYERLSMFAVSLLGIYFSLTLACGVSYALAGMSGFDALNHAMTTVSTAGFSTHDASLGFYADQPAVLWVGTIFMFIGGLPFSILILLATRGHLDALRDPQIRVFASYCLVFVVAMTIYLRISSGLPLFDAFTHSAFNFVSIITTTGYASTDYTLWGPFAVGCVFVATALGGCSGSTTGGIKAYRFLIMFELFANRIRKLVYPDIVSPVRYGDRPVAPELQSAVVLFLSAFLVIWGIATVLLTATGLDLLTALSAALTMIANVGPGVGDVIGPYGNFAPLPDPAKWLLSFLMLLGRLEILAVLVVLTPVFWTR